METGYADNALSNPVSDEALQPLIDQDEEFHSGVGLMAYEQVYEPEDGANGREEAPLIDPKSRIRPPPDRYKAVFLIMGFLGLASLLPWNFFITAKKYFDFKFRNTSLPSDVPFDDKAHGVQMQKLFESYLSIVANGSNLFFMVITMLLVRKVPVKVRIIVSTLLMITIFIVTTSLVEVNTDTWQNTFFILTLMMSATMSGVQSVLTGSVLGLSALFPAKYSQSAMIGQAAGGTFSAVVSILTSGSASDPLTSALTYFLTATVVTFLSLVAYLSLHYIRYSKFHVQNNEKALLKSLNEEVSYPHLLGIRYFFAIISKIWMYLVSLCLVFTVTLSVFPAVCSIIKSTSGKDNDWTETYFTPVVCFLVFNVSDFVGRLSTFFFKIPRAHQPALMLVLCSLRIGFIPLLMLCNAQPRHHLSVVFENDAFPAVFILALGLTNGYLSTLCMTYGPSDVEEELAEGSGMMLALGITLGLALGSGLSFLTVSLL